MDLFSPLPQRPGRAPVAGEGPLAHEARATAEEAYLDALSGLHRDAPAPTRAVPAARRARPAPALARAAHRGRRGGRALRRVRRPPLTRVPATATG